MTVDIEYTRGTQVSCPGIKLFQLHCRVCHNFILNPLIAIYLILYGLTLSRSVGEGCARLPMIHILCMFHALKPENTPLKTTLVMHENDPENVQFEHLNTHVLPYTLFRGGPFDFFWWGGGGRIVLRNFFFLTGQCFFLL